MRFTAPLVWLLREALMLPIKSRTALSITLYAVILAWSGAPAAVADALTVPIATFTNPTYIAVAPGKPRLLFVVERTGVIQVLPDKQNVTMERLPDDRAHAVGADHDHRL